MNVIEYIQNFDNNFELFEATFETELISFHFDKPGWESKAVFTVMNKATVENLEKALMISVIQIFVRFGDYYFKDSAQNDIYNTCVEHLNDHYGNAKFDSTEKTILEDCIGRFFSDTEQKIYSNYKWENQLSVEPIKKMEWTKQSTYKTYHLKSEWNDEDYLFETEGYFIRFNWSTSA